MYVANIIIEIICSWENRNKNVRSLKGNNIKNIYTSDSQTSLQEMLDGRYLKNEHRQEGLRH
jgi:hypothetical protein